MQPIPQDRLKEILTPLAELFRNEANMDERAIVEYAVGYVNDGYESRTVAAFVDNLDKPQSCLVLKTGRSWMHPATACIILTVWVHPDARGNSTALRTDMMKTAEAFARLNGCESIYGSSWVYLGHEDISALWSSQGFDLQEKLFVKSLT
jgi:GNAT superfamily N-acetyltransferase